MLRALIILTLSFLLGKANTQTLKVDKLINQVYRLDRIPSRIDTVLFFNSGHYFFSYDSIKDYPIKVYSFSIKDKYEEFRKNHPNNLIAYISILEIYKDNIRMLVELYQPQQMKVESYSDVFSFVDKRIVSCIPSEKGWVFYRNVKLYDQ